MKSATPLPRSLPALAPDIPPASGISPAELELITRGRVNVLLCGPAPSLSAALAALRPRVARPVTAASGAGWQAPSSATATLIVENVSALLPHQQRAMLEWLDTVPSSVQVICTSERSIYDLVERGKFSDRLFYRLNMMYLQL